MALIFQLEHWVKGEKFETDTFLSWGVSQPALCAADHAAVQSGTAALFVTELSQNTPDEASEH